jgi:LuxR family maltose regulon positive regulatory protein
MQDDRHANADRLLHFPLVHGDPGAPRRSGPPELLRRSLVRRDRLVQLIEEPFLPSVTQVIAGAGYGKTTLIADWASRASLPVSWIRLSPAENRAARLASTLGRAIREHFSHRFQPDTEPADHEIAVLAELASSIDEPACLVLDDAHLLTDAGAIQVINDLIASLPASFHLIVISRARLPLRLGRLRVMGQVRDIGAGELSFTEQETARVLLLETGAEPDHELAAIAVQAEGWATGVFLASLLLGGDGPLAGQDRHALHDAYLDEYVQQEILAPLDDESQSFLLAVAFLPFLSAELCDATLTSHEGAERIARLTREFAFVSALPGNTGRCAIHPLVRHSLRRLAAATPDPQHGPRHSRAARYLLDAGELTMASQLARESADPDLIADIAESACYEHAIRSDFDAITDCLDPLPEEAISSRLNLRYWRIAARLMVGRTIGTDALIREVEQGWLASDDALLVGRVWLCRGVRAYFAGDDPGAATALTTALQQLPDEARVEKLHAITFLGRSAFRQGRDDDATTISSRSPEFTFGLPLDEQWSWRTLGADRGNAYALRGDIYSAITKYRLMISELPPALGKLEGFYRCRLINLAIERHELESADHDFKRVEELMGSGPAFWHHDAMLARMRLLTAQGRREEAEEWGSNYIKELRRLPAKIQLVLILARIWLERGELPLVRSWLNDIDAQEHPWMQVFGDINHRILALTLDLVEEKYAEVAESAARMLAEAEATRRWAEVISISMRRAIALHYLGRHEDACLVMRAAIERGARGGFVRTFFVPGFDTVGLFAGVWNESGDFTRVRRRLQTLQERSTESRTPLLTRREIELLSLVALGRSNQQIAADLYISVNTVRNHLVKICRRLNATSRLEAVTRARELGAIE